MENKRILVIGGNGYIGREIVKELQKENYQVKIISRKGNLNTLKGSVLDKYFLQQVLKENYQIIIYLVAIIRTIRKRKYKENIIGLKNTIEAIKKKKIQIKKFIYFSTQNVKIKKLGPYGNSKKQSEQMIKKSRIPYLIVRPNYVYGIDKKNDFYKLAKIMKTIRICPIIGNGETQIQPINKEDVAKIIKKIIKQNTNKKLIEISGNSTVTINNIVDMIQKKLKIKTIKIHIPLRLLKIVELLIPLDIEGYTENRITKDRHETTHNLEGDLKQIIKLT